MAGKVGREVLRTATVENEPVGSGRVGDERGADAARPFLPADDDLHGAVGEELAGELPELLHGLHSASGTLDATGLPASAR